MLNKNVWIPILILVLVVIGFGLFYRQKVATQAPVKVYKPVEVSKPATLKPPPPGETAESGHWHGDEWHAQPHDTHAPAQPQHGDVSEVKAEPSQVVEPTESTPIAPQTPPETAPIDLKALEGSMMARYKRFQEISETLPVGRSKRDVIVASGLVPSQEELRTMSDDELSSLRKASLEKADEIYDEMISNMGNGEYGEALRYEYSLRRAPADMVLAESERRYQTSFERLPPDQRFITIIPQVADELKKQLEERYERQQEESNR